MLQSTEIQRRQSAIREELATLAGLEAANDDQVKRMQSLDSEYKANETRFRAALIAEDTERREAGAVLETRADKEWSDLVAGYEVRQAALQLDEGRPLSGRTAEVVQELRSKGGFRGVPVPFEALEQRNTVASGVPDPIQTMPIVDRLFAQSVAARMGISFVSIPAGEREWPLTTSSVTAGWADGEAANVAGPTAFATTDYALAPDHNLGITMAISRKALLQSGAGLESAIRRDMSNSLTQELDKAIFLGTGANGQPLGIVSGRATYGINDTDASAAASWALFRTEITALMTANAANGPGDVRVLFRPEIWNGLDGSYVSGTAVSQFELMTKWVPASNIIMSSNAVAAPAGDPLESIALLTTSAGGVAPGYVGLWSAGDLIRDPYSDARSGGLRLTLLTTADVQVVRAAQSRVISGLQ